MSASDLPSGVDRFEYTVVEAAIDYLLNVTEEIWGYEIAYDPEARYACFKVAIKTVRGEYIGVGRTLMDASTEAVDMLRQGPGPDPDEGNDEPEAA